MTKSDPMKTYPEGKTGRYDGESGTEAFIEALKYPYKLHDHIIMMDLQSLLLSAAPSLSSYVTQNSLRNLH